MGGIENICFLTPELITSSKPICLDLGGIAKGFAVDMAVKILISEGISSGVVNAGGDLRVFGNRPQAIHIRNPRNPAELLEIGVLHSTAVATSNLYFAKRDQQASYLINLLAEEASQLHIESKDPFSVIAKECVYVDALTKILAITKQVDHPCFATFSAQAVRIAA